MAGHSRKLASAQKPCHCPLSSDLTTVSTGQGLYLGQVATVLYKNVKSSFLPFQFEEGEEGEEEVRPR